MRTEHLGQDRGDARAFSAPRACPIATIAALANL